MGPLELNLDVTTGSKRYTMARGGGLQFKHSNTAVQLPSSPLF